ncbi:MAG TPA: CBS domain-containing protein [Nitrolancea sp.]|nr:CBS domain-containing protein [Nitrolancea sp.]
MDDQVQSFRPHAELTQVLEAMRKGKLDRAVVTNSDGQLLGAFLRTDVEQASMTH